MFRDRFWLSLLLTIPVVVWSTDPQEWLGYTAPVFPGSDWIPPILGTLVFLYGGIPFLRGGVGELRDRTPGMMTLISLAILVSFVTSWASTLGWLDVEIWWELATLITIMLLGHWLEMRSIAQAQGALAALAALLPDTAERVTADGTATVPVPTCASATLCSCGPAAASRSTARSSRAPRTSTSRLITGESRPVAKEPGAAVIAGSVVVGGSLRVRVTAVGDQTTLSGIVRLVDAAQASQSHAQALGDRAAALLFYVALVAGAATFVGWLLLGDPEGAVIRSATVLVIACPHALGLAIPLVVAISTTLGARNGLLVKDRLALESARIIDTVIFDKTGTLTRGEPVLVEVAAAETGRRTTSWHWPRQSSRTPSTRWEARSSQQHGSGDGPFRRRPGSRRWPDVAHGPWSTVGPSLSVDRRCCVSSAWSRIARAEAWDREGRTVLHVVDGRVFAGCSRPRTRSDPSRRRRSPSSTGWASGWR